MPIVYVRVEAKDADCAFQGLASDGPELCEPGRYYRTCLVESDGSVLAWDSVADHFTSCHSLSEAQQDEARRLATLPRRMMFGEEVVR